MLARLGPRRRGRVVSNKRVTILHWNQLPVTSQALDFAVTLLEDGKVDDAQLVIKDASTA